MPIEHPLQTEATVKKLYAHAFGCAFEGCSRTLYKLDDETGVRTLNSRVCHINARREGGPRWDPDQSPEDNRSEPNLVLMCVEHAADIDKPETLSAYPAERLCEWKRKQLEQYDRIQQGWVLDTEMAREAIEASSSLAEIVISNSRVNLGGRGGQAPGAGGGGGGAIGKNCAGGPGGKGGDIRIDDGDYTLPCAEGLPLALDMDELARLGVDYIPGAGGGGAGALGEGARGGKGGDGGDYVSANIDIAKLRKAGLHHIDYTVGEGGQNGCDGGDTILKFMTEDGRVLKTIRACGGKSGTSALPAGVAQIGPEDINDNFRISTLIIANAVEIRDGLFYLLGADWDRFFTPHFPFETNWPVIWTARWKPHQWSAPRGLFLSLLRPNGNEAARQALIIPSEIATEGFFHRFEPLGVKLDAEGIWTLKVHSGSFLLVQIEVKVMVTPPPSF